MIHKAIYSLYPSATYINEGGQAFDAQGNVIELNMTEVNSEAARLQAEFQAKDYQRKRVKEYPSIGDQLDALFHAGVFPSDMAAQIKTVKDKFPKV
jgi:hypothetical protein